jgi:hypothetical protein
MNEIAETVSLKGSKKITVEKFFADESFVADVKCGTTMELFCLAERGLSTRLRGSGTSALLLAKLRDVSVSHLTGWVDTTDVVNYSRVGSKPYVLMEVLSAQRSYDYGATVLARVPTPILLQALDAIFSRMLAHTDYGIPRRVKARREKGTA